MPGKPTRILPRLAGAVAAILTCAVACVSFPQPANSFGYESRYPMLEGRKVFILGDSIQANPKYGQYVLVSCQALRVSEMTSQSRSGATVARRNKGNNLHSLLESAEARGVELGDFDYYIIAAGTNDVLPQRNIEFGSSDSDDLGTTSGALKDILGRIGSAYQEMHPGDAAPNIILITPIGRKQFEDRVQECRAALEEVAGLYPNVSVIDGVELATHEEMSEPENSFEGLHPSPGFSEVIAQRLTEILREDSGVRHLS